MIVSGYLKELGSGNMYRRILAECPESWIFFAYGSQELLIGHFGEQVGGMMISMRVTQRMYLALLHRNE